MKDINPEILFSNTGEQEKQNTEPHKQRNNSVNDNTGAWLR